MAANLPHTLLCLTSIGRNSSYNDCISVPWGHLTKRKIKYVKPLMCPIRFIEPATDLSENSKIDPIQTILRLRLTTA